MGFLVFFLVMTLKVKNKIEVVKYFYILKLGVRYVCRICKEGDLKLVF